MDQLKDSLLMYQQSFWGNTLHYYCYIIDLVPTNEVNMIAQERQKVQIKSEIPTISQIQKQSVFEQLKNLSHLMKLLISMAVDLYTLSTHALFIANLSVELETLYFLIRPSVQMLKQNEYDYCFLLILVSCVHGAILMDFGCFIRFILNSLHKNVEVSQVLKQFMEVQ
ncbi:MAG: hypothetical protein EZS28_016058 [Streblomastix strix]|uniref:Transmembrane protein n=1 Tax=Streblomastix strix TaxID=222440 RepID=A0A5J4W1S8_9EUKA|nr:MAG: hypothetical protein EZS28_016058 [Streblomastix strix]